MPAPVPKETMVEARKQNRELKRPSSPVLPAAPLPPHLARRKLGLKPIKKKLPPPPPKPKREKMTDEERARRQVEWQRKSSRRRRRLRRQRADYRPLGGGDFGYGICGNHPTGTVLIGGPDSWNGRPGIPGGLCWIIFPNWRGTAAIPPYRQNEMLCQSSDGATWVRLYVDAAELVNWRVKWIPPEMRAHIGLRFQSRRDGWQSKCLDAVRRFAAEAAEKEELEETPEAAEPEVAA